MTKEQIAAKQASSKALADKNRLLRQVSIQDVHFHLNDIRKNSRYFKITHLRLYLLTTTSKDKSWDDYVNQEVILLPPHVARTMKEAGFHIQILANGGLSTIEAVDNQGVRKVGVSRCHQNDGFSRAEGRAFALKNYLYNLKNQ